jgi:hypothetical protein
LIPRGSIVNKPYTKYDNGHILAPGLKNNKKLEKDLEILLMGEGNPQAEKRM